MSIDDRDPPLHKISGVEERERLLAEAMAHAETQEAHYRVLPAGPPTHNEWKVPLALLVFALAGLAAAFPPAWSAGPPPLSVQDGDLDRGLRAAVYLQAVQVEVYRLRNGRLPDDLAELPTHLPDLSLVKSNNRVFQILGRRPDGAMLVYDSAHPSPAFASVASGWGGGRAP